MSRLMPRASVLAVLMMLVQIAGGQTQSAKQTTLSNDEQRKQLSTMGAENLLQERDILTTEITDLNNRIWYANDATHKVALRAQQKARGQSTAELDKQISASLSQAQIEEKPPDALDSWVQQQRDLLATQLEEKKSRKALLDEEMTRRLDLTGPQQTFKLKMSSVFAALVGLVIVGFFIMAGLDEQVRREIFAGQVGIQFVTLFSLVIAIILFGIIDILEGKELAALLGGLSGYILGRAMPNIGSGKKEPVSAGEPQPAGTDEKTQPQLIAQAQIAGRR
jgi:hypothetical protein